MKQTAKHDLRELHSEVPAVRQASRQMVRELGFLDHWIGGCGVSHSQCHALIELEHHGVLTAGELSDLLNLDKSTLSRTLKELLEAEYVAVRGGGEDKRKKPLTLAKKGLKQLDRIHAYANDQVHAALSLLSEAERRTVVEGLALYAKALARTRAQSELAIRPMLRSDNPDVARIIRTVMPEFGANGPGFAINDPEVGQMFESYSGDQAGYFVVTRGGDRVVGGAGFGPLAGGGKDVCELRKMYFLPEARGTGMGRKLLLLVLERAREAGFKTCYLETLEKMTQARRLYESVGFEKLCKPLGATGHFGCDSWYAKKL
jgi:putative acetyltransferase